MQCTLPQQALRDGLATIQPAVAPKPMLPILANVLLEADADGGLWLQAMGLEVSIRVRVPAQVAQAGALTVPAKRLTDLAKVLPAGMVHAAAAGETLSVRGGHAAFTLHGLRRDGFPTFPQLDFARGWSVAAATLQRCIAGTAFAASTEESRPILNGILWQLEPTRMRMVATDGHRLARVEVPVTSTLAADAPGATGGPTHPPVTFLVPVKSLDLVARLMRAATPVEVAHAERTVGFRQGDIIITTTLIDGTYPNYEQVIPPEAPIVAVADTAALAAALKRVDVVANAETRRVHVALNGTAELTVETPDVGTARDEVALRYDGAPLTIAFNGRYLLEALAHIETQEVRLRFTSAQRAAMVEPVGAADPAMGEALYLVMPLRVPA